jgi:hypothetical protein
VADTIYPGSQASASEVLALAREYHACANALYASGSKQRPLSRYPFRLLAIHAVELYLNAFLLHKALTASQVRGLQHNLSMRAERAGLKLRQRTRAHIEILTTNREYLAARYAPDQKQSLSQLNRLHATLTELAKKIEAEIARQPAGAA